MKRTALKIAAAPILPILALLIPAGPASADPLHFEPAQINDAGCSGRVTAEVSASQGQQAGEFANFIDSSARVTVNFTPDPNPLGSLSASPGGNCEISTTVTMRNLDTGANKTETRKTEYDGHYGWHAAFFTLEGSGRVAVQVSTNPNPSELIIEVPAPR
ncbi:hypothetical protein [Nocardia wallacei]|uniref:hypothetical protein n=1 Tax=Nocardia wallacei TaxID=480035 RepID=UPI002453B050|nr:hypothetical protein [Nocardia wallacei]